MPLYEYRCAKGHAFEVVQGIHEKPLAGCSLCSAKARRVISQPTLLHNRGLYVFDREAKDDIMRTRPSSLKSLKKGKP